MAELGFRVVGQDQLAGGPPPDNSATVSCLDWETGQPNAKYWSIHLMAQAFGTGTKGIAGITKSLQPSTNTSAVYALPFRRADEAAAEVRRMIVVNKLSVPLALTLTGGWCESGAAMVLEAASNSTAPGFDPPRSRAVTGGKIELGAFALATLKCS